MKEKNYYELLGVTSTATADDIKKAYKALAKKYHPDVCRDADAGEKFARINEAYQCLSVPESRRRYDRGDMDGGEPRTASRPVFRGDDLMITLNLSLEDIVKGVHKSITLKRGVTCHRCSGSGSETNSFDTCPHCQGAGMIHLNNAWGVFSQTCPVCKGAGVRVKDPCPHCHGTGVEYADTGVEFDVPPGMPDGGNLLMRGYGSVGMFRGVCGDLIINVKEMPNDRGYLRDEKNNLHYTMHLPVSRLINGCNIDVPHITGGTEPVHVHAGCASGTQFRVRKKGVPDPNGGPASDFVVTVVANIPNATSMCPEERELLRKLGEYGHI